MKNVCEVCGLEKVLKIFGDNRFKIKIPVCPNDCVITDTIEARKNHKEFYEKSKNFYKKVGFSRKFLKWNLSKIDNEHAEFLRKYAKNFNKFSKSLLLVGSTGNGKSVSVECLAKYLFKNGKKVWLTNMTELNLKMNNALLKGKFEQFFAELLELDFIGVDDFGREQYATEKSLENAFYFFNTMLKNKKVLALSCNLESITSISKKTQFGAVFDRFKDSEDFIKLQFTRKSFRG